MDKLQVLIVILSVIIIAILAFFVYSATRGTMGRAALSVDLLKGSGRVTVNGKDFGNAPVYTEDVLADDLNVKIDGDKNSYSTTVKPASGTSAVVKRDLGVNDNFSSGQVIWLEKTGSNDKIISVTSPRTDSVSVIVEGVEVGKTPVRFSTKDLLSEKEDGKYKVVFTKTGYEDQELELVVAKGYTMNIVIDMFLQPIPKDISEISVSDTSGKYFDFSKASGAAFVDKQGWAKGVNYWAETRGSIKVGQFNIDKFSYFIDNNGKVYNADGSEVNASDLLLDDKSYIAYLGDNSETGLSSSAKETLAKATGKEVVVETSGGNNTTAGNKSVKIKPTGNTDNHLNVRSGPGTGNAKVGTVFAGSVFKVLEENNEWVKIEYETGKTGWVVNTYLETVSE